MPKLFDLFVEFSQKGAQAVSAAMQDLQQQSAQLARGMQGISDRQLALVAAATAAAARQQADLHRKLELVQRVAERGAFRVLAEDVGRRLQPALRGLTAAATLAGGAVAGMALGGIRASAWGQIFQLQMERLARAVGGLLQPELERLVGWLDRLTSRLERLTGEQRQSAANMVQLALAARPLISLATLLVPVLGGVGAAAVALGGGVLIAEGGFARLYEVMRPVYDLMIGIGRVFEAVTFGQSEMLVKLGLLVGTFVAVRRGVLAVAAAFTAWQKAAQAAAAANVALQASAGPVGWVVALASLAAMAAAAAAAAALFGDTEEKAGNRGPLAAKAGGPESIESTYMRIAQASSRVAGFGANTEEMQLKVQEEIRDLIKERISREAEPGGVVPPDFGWGGI